MTDSNLLASDLVLKIQSKALFKAEVLSRLVIGQLANCLHVLVLNNKTNL